MPRLRTYYRLGYMMMITMIMNDTHDDDHDDDGDDDDDDAISDILIRSSLSNTLYTILAHCHVYTSSLFIITVT